MGVTMSMIVAAAAAFRMAVIVPMIVLVIVTAAASVFVLMVMPAVCMIVIIVGIVVMATAVAGFVPHGRQIKDPQHHQADSCRQCHGAENSIWRQVVGDSAAGIKIQKHPSPKEEQCDADQMGDNTIDAQGWKRGMAYLLPSF